MATTRPPWSGPPRPPSKGKQPIIIDHKTTLDGTVMARAVTKYQVAEMRHAGGLGTFDDHGMRIAAGQIMHAV